MTDQPNQHRLHTQDESPLVPHPGEGPEPPYAPVRVEVIGPVQTSTGDDQFGAYSTMVLPASSAVVITVEQLLARDPLRQYAYLTALDAAIVLNTIPEPLQSIGNFAPAISAAGVVASGVASPPTANGIICSGVLPAGTWTVNWTVGLAGTLTAPDRNNFALLLNGNIIATAVNNINVGVTYPQPPLQIVVPAGGATLAIESVLANASGVYEAGFTATPTAPSAAAQAPALPSGYLLLAGMTAPPIRHNEPVYAANTSPAPARVAIAIERGHQS